MWWPEVLGYLRRNLLGSVNQKRNMELLWAPSLGCNITPVPKLMNYEDSEGNV